MRTRFNVILAASIALIAVAIPVWAHHSFSAQYDRNKPITLNGPVTKVDWINPHARFFVDVKDAGGKVVNWEIELASPNGLMRRGWTRNSLKIGDAVTVDAFMSKNGAPIANARTVVLADGKKVFAGSSSEGESTQ
jgi:hypothetical protein